VPIDEATYDRQRLAQWRAGEARGEGISRRTLMRLSAALGAGVAVPGLAAPSVARAAEADPDAPIVKPLPPELFTVFGTNARCAGRPCATRATWCRSTGSSSATTPGRR
jgi:hypothetical protein